MAKPTKERKGTVAVIDDDEAARVSIGQMLRLRGYSVEAFSSAASALAWPGLANADCVVCDVKMPGMDGEEFLAKGREQGVRAPVVMITGHGDISMAVRCLKSGAYDFVEKPFPEDVLLASVARAAEKTALRLESEELRSRLKVLSPGETGQFGMVGRSPAARDLYQQIEVAASSDAPVLIIGETGVGKDLVARAIHALSARAGKPYVPVNAGALPDTMLESELFGHARGAFTGAERARDGKLVAASGGTLLLDEVESLSEPAQVKLLRVTEDGMVYPLGKEEPRRVDVRLLATTKVDLRDCIKRGLFREDFYHRIVVLEIHVPPLRERALDIPLLIAHLLREAASQVGVPVPRIPERALGEMLTYGWPGNIRELKHAIERMVITSHGGVAGEFSSDEGFSSCRLLSLPATSGRLRDELERTERSTISEALQAHEGVVTRTCQTLGISRRALYERMKKYGLDKQDFSK